MSDLPERPKKSPPFVTIYFFRHGETDWNRDGRLQGHTDIPLNDKGRAQAQSLAPILRQIGLTHLLSSDLSRAAETAQIAAHDLKLEIQHDPRLREIRYGKLEGLSAREITERYGRRYGDLYSRPFTDQEITDLGGEPVEALMTRVMTSVDQFLLNHGSGVLSAQGSVGVSTHGGVIRRLLHALDPWRRFPPPIPNCVIFPFRLTKTDDGAGSLSRSHNWEVGLNNKLLRF